MTASPRLRHPLRHLLAALLLPAGIAATLPTAAQDYPNKSVKVVVPYAPGGQADSGTRIITAALSQLLGQAFVVENIGGSSGFSAMQNVMKAAPDGYTLTYQDSGHWAINPALYPKIPYDTLRDFTPVGLYASTTLFLVAPASFPANTAQEAIALIRANPDKFTYASSGIGSPHHLTMEDFKAQLGLKVLHVPFKGTGQSIPALVGGQVSMGIAGLTSVAGFVKDGRVKLLAANAKARSIFAPNVPTMGEVGNLPDFDHGGGLGIFAPAGTPRAIVDRLSQAMAKAIATADIKDKLGVVGLEPVPSTAPEKLIEAVRFDRPKFARIIKANNITPEQ